MSSRAPPGMKRDNINYLLVGAFVLAMGVASLVLLLAVTGRSGPTDSYSVVYDNVAGLKYGTGVFFEGFRIGQVENIVPESGPDGVRYRLTLDVQAGWQIPRDSVAMVAASGLISAVTIDIRRGQDRALLAPGDTIPGRGQTDLFSVLNQAAGDFRTLSQDGIMPVLANLNARISEVADELVKFRREELSPLTRRMDQEVIGETLAVLKHLDESARGLEALLSDTNQSHVTGILSHVEGVAANLDGLVQRLESTRTQMDHVLVALDGVIADNRAPLTAGTVAAQNSMRELDTALRTLNRHLGQILGNLEGGSRHMNEFARAIRENPARLLRNSEPAEPGGR